MAIIHKCELCGKNYDITMYGGGVNTSPTDHNIKLVWLCESCYKEYTLIKMIRPLFKACPLKTKSFLHQINTQVKQEERT